MNTPNALAGEYIRSNSEELAKKIFEHHIRLYGEPKPVMGSKDGTLYTNGIKYQLLFLSESLNYSSPELFLDALNWGKSFMPSIGLDSEHISMVLYSIKEAFRKTLPEEIRDVSINFIDKGLTRIAELPGKASSYIKRESKYFKETKDYLDLLLESKRSEAGRLIIDMAEQGVPIKELYLEIFQVTQYEIGRLWQLGELTVAQEHYCTAATQLIMSQLYSYIFQTENIEKIFIGTCVSGELHEIGIRMLSDLLEMEGWDTYYLGANMPARSVVDTIADKKADLVGISATMTFHINKAHDLIKAIRQEENCRHAKILVGGYVFNTVKGLWKKIDADGYGRDLEHSLKQARNITKK